MGRGSPSGEPNPTVYTTAPCSRASLAAATGSPSWFSPSVMTTMIFWLARSSLNPVREVRMAFSMTVPCREIIEGFAWRR